jgi:hypothetical protein
MNFKTLLNMGWKFDGNIMIFTPLLLAATAFSFTCLISARGERLQ